LGVFETLDRAGIPYCVTHGYESYPVQIRSDVDGTIAAEVRPSELVELVHENRTSIAAEVVQARGYRLVLAGKDADGSPCFVTLDLSADYEVDDRPFYTGREVLEARRRHQQFWIPSADLEFGCYLVRKIAKGHLDDEDGRRLSSLYQQDAAGCRQQVARFWGAARATLILSSASSGDWEPVRRRLDKLRAELRRRATLRSPFRVLGNRLRRMGHRVRALWRSDSGLNLVFLGPDGAGKSSVIQAVGQELAGVFNRTIYCGFAPALFEPLRYIRREPGRPHGALPRSFPVSVMRAGYWFVYYTFGYFVTVHVALARSALVLQDRHFVDALVDPRRYRYGGPLWLLRLIWRVVPKPDLIVLLDAAPEVLQSRKQEVPFEETVRQRTAYLSLVGTMRNAYVIDATRPFGQVVGDVNDLILRHLTTRIERRLGLQQTCSKATNRPHSK
jgi:thymidylate kinase